MVVNPTYLFDLADVLVLQEQSVVLAGPRRLLDFGRLMLSLYRATVLLECRCVVLAAGAPLELLNPLLHLYVLGFQLVVILSQVAELSCHLLNLVHQQDMRLFGLYYLCATRTTLFSITTTFYSSMMGLFWFFYASLHCRTTSSNSLI